MLGVDEHRTGRHEAVVVAWRPIGEQQALVAPGDEWLRGNSGTDRCRARLRGAPGDRSRVTSRVRRTSSASSWVNPRTMNCMIRSLYGARSAAGGARAATRSLRVSDRVAAAADAVRGVDGASRAASAGRCPASDRASHDVAAAIGVIRQLTLGGLRRDAKTLDQHLRVHAAGLRAAERTVRPGDLFGARQHHGALGDVEALRRVGHHGAPHFARDRGRRYRLSAGRNDRFHRVGNTRRWRDAAFPGFAIAGAGRARGEQHQTPAALQLAT